MNAVAYLALLVLTSLVTSRPIDDIDLPDATDLPDLPNLDDGRELGLELEEKEEDVAALNASVKDDARKSKEEEQRSIGAERGVGEVEKEEKEEREEEEKMEPISMEDLDLDRRIEDIQGFEETGVSPREIVAFVPDEKVHTDRMEKETEEKEQITHKIIDASLARDSAADFAAQLIPGGSSIEKPDTDWAALLAWAAFLPRFEEKAKFPVLIATQPDWENNRMDEVSDDARRGEKMDREEYLGGRGGPGPEGPSGQMREPPVHNEERNGMDMNMLNERRRLETMSMTRGQSSSSNSEDLVDEPRRDSGAGVIDLKTFLPEKPDEEAVALTTQPERIDPIDSHHYLSNNNAADEIAPPSQFHSVLAGLKCALRDCRDAMPLRPTPPPRPLEDRFIIRKARS